MTEKDKVVVALTTCPSEDVAKLIADTLVSERLAACVNRIPGVASTYLWQGQMQTDTEILLVIKTTDERFQAVKTRLIALHPYELPELITLPVCAGSEQYLQWVRQTVSS